MKDLRIVFMGTPDFAVTILDALITQKQNVVGVITAPDKPAGRGRKLNASAVKKYALKQALPILQPTNLKDSSFLDALKALDANLQIVVAFRMLPKQVWQLPKFGTFNLHASLLPQYRGAAPIHWAIINGETTTGVTTFFIDEKIDTGEIIGSKKIAISNTDTVGLLHDKLMHLGAELVLETVNTIEKETVITKKQPETAFKAAPKLNKENTKINWSKDAITLYNFIRGLNPFPAAWSYLKNNNITVTAKIYDVSYSIETHNYPNGKIINSKNNIKIAVLDGFIHINSIKIEGKRKMDVASLVNGYSFLEDAKML